MKTTQENRNSLIIGGVALLVVVLALGRLLAAFSGTPAEHNRHKARQVIAHGVARAVAERYPESKVVLLGMPELPPREEDEEEVFRESRELDAKLFKALNKRGVKVERLAVALMQPEADLPQQEIIILKQDDPERDPALYLEESVEAPMADTAPLADQLFDLKERADVVILTLPISPSAHSRDLPAKGQAPHLILIQPPPWRGLDGALETTVLDSVLMYRSNTTELAMKKWPKSDEEAFDQRFYFLSSDHPKEGS